MNSVTPSEPTLLDFDGQLRDWTQNPLLRLIELPLSDPIVFHHIDGRVGVPLFFLESPAKGASVLRDAEGLVNLSGLKIVLGWPGHKERHLDNPVVNEEGNLMSKETLFKLIWAEARTAFDSIFRYESCQTLSRMDGLYIWKSRDSHSAKGPSVSRQIPKALAMIRKPTMPVPRPTYNGVSFKNLKPMDEESSFAADDAIRRLLQDRGERMRQSAASRLSSFRAHLEEHRHALDPAGDRVPSARHSTQLIDEGARGPAGLNTREERPIHSEPPVQNRARDHEHPQPDIAQERSIGREDDRMDVDMEDEEVAGPQPPSAGPQPPSAGPTVPSSHQPFPFTSSVREPPPIRRRRPHTTQPTSSNTDRISLHQLLSQMARAQERSFERMMETQEKTVDALGTMKDAFLQQNSRKRRPDTFRDDGFDSTDSDSDSSANLKMKPTRHKAQQLLLMNRIRWFLASLERRNSEQGTPPDEESGRSITQFPRPSNRLIRRFEQGRHIGPTPENFSIAYQQPPNALWNQRARVIFATKFIDHFASFGYSFSVIAKRIYVHLRGRRTAFRKAKRNLTEGQAALERAKDRRRARRLDLFWRRVRSASRTPGLHEVAKVVATLGTAGMSSDESDGDNGEGFEVFKIHPRLDRAAWLTRILRGLDKLHYNRRQTGSRFGGKTQGRLPHVRRLSNIYSRAPPVPGLRQNWSYLTVEVQNPETGSNSPAISRFLVLGTHELIGPSSGQPPRMPIILPDFLTPDMVTFATGRPAALVPHFDFDGLLQDWSKNSLLTVHGAPLNPPIVFRHIDGRVGVPLFYMDSPDMGASLLRDPETNVDLCGDRLIFGWPGYLERYPLIPIRSTTIAGHSNPDLASGSPLILVSSQSGELMLTYSVGDHTFETRLFHAVPDQGPARAYSIKSSFRAILTDDVEQSAKAAKPICLFKLSHTLLPNLARSNAGVLRSHDHDGLNCINCELGQGREGEGGKGCENTSLVDPRYATSTLQLSALPSVLLVMTQYLAFQTQAQAGIDGLIPSHLHAPIEHIQTRSRRSRDIWGNDAKILDTMFFIPRAVVLSKGGSRQKREKNESL
ncbi:hypothetical protein SISSUDRAFT_1037151 [Sistotremastrum suecicum HHB10207 ss-3]|uniref:Uncharacterized protein n=1 Tax=Sistotremastrum suecicum HHB10207 ss-3 TaxID=1314776 RepID=A0A165YIZ2_9AGAM|nr:hypothetical protein SISSUDRAFT_1037151 [Sistotremastrum suecicum HHB10207 ss-3]